MMVLTLVGGGDGGSLDEFVILGANVVAFGSPSHEPIEDDTSLHFVLLQPSVAIPGNQHVGADGR